MFIVEGNIKQLRISLIDSLLVNTGIRPSLDL